MMLALGLFLGSFPRVAALLGFDFSTTSNSQYVALLEDF